MLAKAVKQAVETTTQPNSSRIYFKASRYIFSSAFIGLAF